jgi:hypothetical protein
MQIVERRACGNGDNNLSIKAKAIAQTRYNLLHKPRLNGQNHNIGLLDGCAVIG